MRFLLIDAIRDHDPGTSIDGIKNVTMSEDLFTHHFPQTPIMPGLLLVESMVQLARWMLIVESDFVTTGLVSTFDTIKFREFVVPGEQVEVHVETVPAADSPHSFRGAARVGGRDRAVASFVLQQVPLSELEDPPSVRQAYAILWRHGDRGRRR